MTRRSYHVVKMDLARVSDDLGFDVEAYDTLPDADEAYAEAVQSCADVIMFYGEVLKRFHE